MDLIFSALSLLLYILSVPQFVADTISMFQPMVFQEGDYICKEGTQADEMFFMVKGKAGIYYGDKLVVVIEEGSYFGEIGCIMVRFAVRIIYLQCIQLIGNRVYCIDVHRAEFGVLE